LFFILANLISWILWLPLILADQSNILESLRWLHPIGLLGPSFSALGVTYLYGKRTGLTEWVKSITNYRAHLVWYIIAIAGPFILLGSGIVIQLVVAPAIPITIDDINYNKEFPSLGIFYWFIAILYGFGEQVGWRGYALPKLEEKGMTSRKATFILGLFWFLWHVPLFGYSLSYGNMVENNGGGIYGLGISMSMILLTMIFASFLQTWIYNSSGRNIVVISLFHGFVDIVMMTRLGFSIAGSFVMMITMVAGVLALLFAGPDVKSNIFRKSDKRALAEGQPTPEKAAILMSKLGFPRSMYLWMGDRGWKKEAKEHIEIKKMYDQP
jgi:hypothetical protein